MSKYIKTKDGTLREYKKADLKKAALFQSKYLYFDDLESLKYFLELNKNLFSNVYYSYSKEAHTAEDGTKIFTIVL